MVAIRPPLVFWFETPPKISKGAFNYVSRAWGNRVLYICRRDVSADRKAIKWNDGDFGNAEVIMLSDFPNVEEHIKETFESHRNSIHIVNGFDNPLVQLLKKHIKSSRYKVVFHSEKPTVTFLGLKGLCQRTWIPLKYRAIYFEYRKVAKALITFGMYGKRVFESFGWEAERVFNYMYCPPEKAIRQNSPAAVSNEVKFLYVGRFNFRTRALDVLMEAIDSLTGSFHFTLVGGYGENSNEVIDWATSREKVAFAGKWPSDEVGIRMSGYDVYVAPTRADGWNVQVNDALRAGLGVITTTEAVSDELITASGAGIVVPANDARALAKALQCAVDNPDKVYRWKEKALVYAPRISSEAVGNYFVEILDYLFITPDRNRPACPWL